MHSNNYTDKRTGIVYTNVTSTTKPNDTTTALHKHLDTFISDTFLKNYFDKGKSWNDSITLLRVKENRETIQLLYFG